MTPSRVVEEILTRREGRRNVAYRDDRGFWTNGIGHKMFPNTDAECDGVYWDDPKVDDVFAKDVAESARVLNDFVHVPLKQNQFDALCCFLHQFGQMKFLSSDLYKKLNAGDYLGAADELLRWDHEGPKVISSILERRKEERCLFLGQAYTPPAGRY